ncbi:MAG: TldD/PmbA family protein [Proteobacteria bacterium]|nr:TldD/PmbA family protein [Pseudomonadota bacterium]
MSELLTRAQDAVRLAQSSGAQGAWASASRSRKVEFTARDGELEKVQEDTSRSVSLQLYVDGRYSSHSTTSLTPARLKSFVAEAVELTRALAPDEHRQLPDPALFEGVTETDLKLVDGTIASITRDQRMAWLKELFEGTRGHDGTISATTYASDHQSERAMASSNGFAGAYDGTQVWVGAEVTVQDEGDKRPEGGHWLGVRHLDGFPSMQAVGAEALKKATDRLGSVQGPTERTRMIVDPQAGGRLLSYLLRPASARAFHQGKSFWKAAMGNEAFSKALTMVDDPLLPGALGSRLFDGEGIASKPLTLVEAGVPQNVYVDTYYGRKAGMTPTTGGRSNITLKPSVDKDLAGLLADTGEGIYVTSWLGGNSDSTTGDFSFGLRGHVVHKGQLVKTVGEMNVTGNLTELFANLSAVGNDPWVYRSTQSPTLVFDGVQFSGA